MTVAVVLNDFGHTLVESPKTVAWMLANPPMSERETDFMRRRPLVQQVAAEAEEKVPHHQALEVLPTFHADNRKFYTVGGNSVNELTPLRVQRDRKTGRRVVVLDLPDYLQNKRYL